MSKRGCNLIDRLEQYKKAISKTFDEWQKQAEIEVLLDSIIVADESNVSVYPSNCPGKGRASDILIDKDGKPACMFKSKQCKYFAGSMFRLVDYTKKIMCKVM